MKNIILLFLLICPAFAQNVKPTGAWLPMQVKWEHAPPSINPRLQTGTTTVLYFGEHGHFAVIDCVVNREPGRYTTVSKGGGQNIWLGEWDGRLPGQVKYRLVSRTIPLTRETLPGSWHRQTLASAPRDRLLFKGKLYRRVEDLDLNVRELLHGSSITQ